MRSGEVEPAQVQKDCSTATSAPEAEQTESHESDDPEIPCASGLPSSEDEVGCIQLRPGHQPRRSDPWNTDSIAETPARRTPEDALEEFLLQQDALEEFLLQQRGAAELDQVKAAFGGRIDVQEVVHRSKMLQMWQSASGDVVLIKGYKSQQCHFPDGRCRKGGSCTFAHGEEDQSKVRLCLRATRCGRRLDCWHAHTVEEARVKTPQQLRALRSLNAVVVPQDTVSGSAPISSSELSQDECAETEDCSRRRVVSDLEDEWASHHFDFSGASDSDSFSDVEAVFSDWDDEGASDDGGFLAASDWDDRSEVEADQPRTAHMCCQFLLEGACSEGTECAHKHSYPKAGVKVLANESFPSWLLK